MSQVFGDQSSFLNKFLFFALYSAGAFSASFDSLDNTVREYDVLQQNILCRYGTDAMTHLLDLFADPEHVKATFELIRDRQGQKAGRYWVPGCFPQPN